MESQVCTDKCPLDEKYRPTSFDEIIGQDPIVESLKARLASPSCPHAFLLTGVSGVGKTTTAYIIASMLGCTKSGLTEMDAASSGQIDDVRQLVGDVYQRALGSPVRVFIIDECHNISTKAFDAFLKTIEKPPKHAYFIFCTTDAKNLATTVTSRCATYQFQPVPTTEIRDYIKCVIAENEGITCTDNIFDLVAETARGSVRQALSNLGTVTGVSDEATAAKLLNVDPPLTGELKEIALLMVNGEKSWPKYQALLSRIPREAWGNTKPLLCGYVAARLMNTKSEKSALVLANVMDAIEQMPSYPAAFEYKSSLLCAIWRVILNS